MNLLSTVSPIVLADCRLRGLLLRLPAAALTLGLAGFAVGLALGLAIARLIPGTSHVFTVVIGIVCGILGAVLATLLYKFGVFLLGAGAGALCRRYRHRDRLALPDARPSARRHRWRHSDPTPRTAAGFYPVGLCR